MANDVLIPINDRLMDMVVAAAGQTIFDFDFPVFHESHILVRRTRDTDVSLLAIHVDYEVVIDPVTFVGQVILTAGALAGDLILLIGATPYQRVTDFTKNGAFAAFTINTELDLMEQQIQQLARQISQAILFDYGTSVGLLPAGSEGQLISFDENGNLVLLDASILSTPGADGLSVYLMDGAPANSFGMDGETYIDRQTLILYTKDGGNWSAVGSIIGPAGPAPQVADNGNGSYTLTTGGNQVTWYDGTAGLNSYALNRDPDDSEGVNGESWINVTSKELFWKLNGSWLSVGLLKGDKGDAGEVPTITDNGDGTYDISNGTDTITLNDGETPTLTDHGDGTFTIATSSQSLTFANGAKGDPAAPPNLIDNMNGTYTITNGLASSDPAFESVIILDGETPTLTDHGDGTKSISTTTQTITVSDGAQGPQGPPGAFVETTLTQDQSLDPTDTGWQPLPFNSTLASSIGAVTYTPRGVVLGQDMAGVDLLALVPVELQGSATTKRAKLRLHIWRPSGAATPIETSDETEWVDADEINIARCHLTWPTFALQQGDEVGIEVKIEYDDIQALLGIPLIALIANVIAPPNGGDVRAAKTRFAIRALQDIPVLPGAGPSSIVQVNTIAELTALDTSVLVDGQRAIVLYHTVPTSLGGGEFYYRSNGADTVDGLKVYQPDTGLGRWHRTEAVINNVVKSSWAGLIGNDDGDADKIQSAIDYASVNGSHLTLSPTQAAQRLIKTINLNLPAARVHWDDPVWEADPAGVFTELTYRGQGTTYDALTPDHNYNTEPPGEKFYGMIDYAGADSIQQTGSVTLDNGGVSGLFVIANSQPGALTSVKWPDYLEVTGDGNCGIGPLRGPGSTWGWVVFAGASKWAWLFEPNSLDEANIQHLRSRFVNVGTIWLNGTIMTAFDIYDASSSLLPFIKMRGSTLITGTTYGETAARETMIVHETDSYLEIGGFRHSGGAQFGYTSGAPIIAEGETGTIKLGMDHRSFVTNSQMQNMIKVAAPNKRNRRWDSFSLATAGDFPDQGVPKRNIEIFLSGDHAATKPVAWSTIIGTAGGQHDHTDDLIVVHAGGKQYTHRARQAGVSAYNMPTQAHEGVQRPDGTALNAYLNYSGELTFTKAFTVIDPTVIDFHTIDGDVGSEPFKRSMFRLNNIGVAGQLSAAAPTLPADAGRHIWLYNAANSNGDVTLLHSAIDGGADNNGVFVLKGQANKSLAPGDNQILQFICVPHNGTYVWKEI